MGCHFLLPPGDLPDPEIEPVSLASPALTGGLFTTAPLNTLKDKWWKNSRRRNEDFESIHLKLYISNYNFVLEKKQKMCKFKLQIGPKPMNSTWWMNSL